MPGVVKTPRAIRSEIRRTKVAKLLLSGITNQSEIARRLGNDVITINADLKIIRQEWRRDMVDLFEHAREEQLRRIDKVEEKAWRGWNRSRRDAYRITKKVGKDGTETTEVVEPQSGEPRFLELVRKCAEDRRKLMGLDEPEKIDIKADMALAVSTLQALVENNGDYVEYQRQNALLEERRLVAGVVSDSDEQPEMEAGEAPDAVGLVVESDGNGQTAVKKPKASRTRVRFD